ncbi:MAG TPA: N(G),N(G)-dimethylarginine dimethylaminohydrolase [Propionibacteriaceae bacterium]
MTQRPLILVRRPSPLLATGELTHQERVPVDPARALEQWLAYVDVFRRHGWAVSEVAPADEHPDGVFVEDTVVVFDHLALLTAPGAVSRQPEVATTEAACTALIDGGVALSMARIEAPGHLDGGDVLKVGRTVYVGETARTDAEGIRQLTALLGPRGWQVVVVPVTKVLHLKSGVTALPDATVVGYAPFVDDPQLYPRFMAVPEVHGAAVVDLGDGAVLMSADAPQTTALWTERGYAVETVAITEFEKLEGCVTCLSVRLRPLA